MLGQEHSRTISPDMLSDRTLYSHFFAKEIERIRHSPYSIVDDMKIAEGGPARMGSSSQYCLRWNNHRNNLLAAFDQLLHVEAFTDVTLACEEGVTLHAHRLVLAACSSYFQALFVNARAANHPIVVLKDVRATDMRALLEYMYRGEVNVEHDDLQGLLRVAESLKIKGLVEELGSDAAVRRPPSPHETIRPATAPVDARTHQELPRIQPEPPTSTAMPSVATHDRASSPKAPSYSLPPPGLPPHRPHHRLDHRDHRLDHRDHRDHIDVRELELRDHLRDHVRDPRDGHEPRETHTPSSLDSDSRQPLSLVPPMPHLPSHCPDSPPQKRKRTHMLSDPMLSPTPILRTALGHTHGFPGTDMSSLVSLASSMMPLPGLLSSHVPHLLPHEHREHLEYGVVPKKEHHDDESRPFSDISREDEQDHKMKLESLANGPLLPDFNPYHLDPNGSSHFSNFVSYVPTPKPEWKRYKQYTKADLMDAIDAVKNGMTALQASRKYKVPSRTLYDKIKKMGISTLPRRLPNKKPSPSSTEIEGSAPDPHPPQETMEPPQPDRDSTPHQDLEKRPIKSVTSDEEDHSTTGPPVVDEEESTTSTPALGSFSLVGRKMFENGGAGETSATPLDLTESDSLIPKRPEIEERA
ncbi:Protein tramtrack, beta isoform [Portunus trituberculatus]|uniref:Protein tramtrack, beta isoform n=1 Tax=Portunus trituberculatus TaxID=210409 RepID=A0A5B7D5I8_PORTR|nr:Protein tramtrack, beta isoform [Portunus trituberculatus]